MKKGVLIVSAFILTVLSGVFLLSRQGAQNEGRPADLIAAGNVTDEALSKAENVNDAEDANTGQNSGSDEYADNGSGNDPLKDNGTITADEMNEKDPDEKASEEQIMEDVNMLPDNPDRVIYREGFSKEPLTEDIRQRINGVSYHENDNITYDDLSFLRVRYKDFDGNDRDGELICNVKIADDLLEIFSDLYENGYEIEKIRLVDEYGADDDLSCADDNTSCFNYRVVAGTDRLSKHALGLAVDVNPFYNPYITYPDNREKISPPGSEEYADRSVIKEHMIDKNDLCYKLFTEHGFKWGGNWKSIKDYQHFEKEDK